MSEDVRQKYEDALFKKQAAEQKRFRGFHGEEEERMDRGDERCELCG